MLRNQVFVLDHMYMSLFSTLGWILRLGVTMALLVSIHPALILLAVFAIPTVATSTWRLRRRARCTGAGRSVASLGAPSFNIATTAPPGKEVRVTGIGEHLVQERRGAWERWYGAVSKARWGSAWWHALAWAIFGLAYVGAVVFCIVCAPRTRRRGAACTGGGCSPVGIHRCYCRRIGFLRGFWADGSRRLAWLEDYAASLQPLRIAAPAVLGRGIRLDHVSFAYPGTSRIVLDDISLTLPAGAVIAIVGENGGGEDDVGEAARQDVRAIIRFDPRRRHAVSAYSGR